MTESQRREYARTFRPVTVERHLRPRQAVHVRDIGASPYGKTAMSGSTRAWDAALTVGAMAGIFGLAFLGGRWIGRRIGKPKLRLVSEGEPYLPDWVAT